MSALCEDLCTTDPLFLLWQVTPLLPHLLGTLASPTPAGSAQWYGEGGNGGSPLMAHYQLGAGLVRKEL